MTQSAFSDTVFTPRSTSAPLGIPTDSGQSTPAARPTHKTHRRRDELLLQKYVPFNPFHAYISGSFLKPSQPVHSKSFHFRFRNSERGFVVDVRSLSFCVSRFTVNKKAHFEARTGPFVFSTQMQFANSPTTHKHTDDMQSVCLLPDLHFLPLLRRVLTADDSTHIQQQHAYLERLAMARKRGSPPAPFAQVDRASARRAPLRQAHRLYIARDGPSAACPSYPCRL